MYHLNEEDVPLVSVGFVVSTYLYKTIYRPAVSIEGQNH